MKLEELLSISKPLPLEELGENQLKELQKALSLLGYPVGEIDGLIGPKTRNAWAEFKTDVYIGNSSLIGRESIEVLQDNLNELGNSGNRDFSTKEKTIESIIQECKSQGLVLNTQISYVIATTKWETAQTFKPVREAFWKSEEWRKDNFRYYPYYGRGYVQLTWENNYKKYSNILDLDLVDEPDLAMQPEIAAFILVHGFKVGTFTGRKISDYINESKSDFVNARRCINGRDKANEIAAIAEGYVVSLENLTSGQDS
jgi:hypothetical protein